MPPFLSWDNDIVSLLWIFFHVDCLSPLNLVVLIGFHLAPSFLTYFFVFSFFWALYACDLLSIDYKTVVPFSGVVCSLLGEVGLEACVFSPYKGIDCYCGNSSLAWIFSGTSTFVLWLSLPCQGQRLLPSSWSRHFKTFFLTMFLICSVRKARLGYSHWKSIPPPEAFTYEFVLLYPLLPVVWAQKLHGFWHYSRFHLNCGCVSNWCDHF